MEGPMSRRRRVVTAALVVLALASAAVACGNDDGDKVSSGDGKQSTTSDTSTQSYVGLTKQAAIAKVKATDTPWRITREDQEVFMVTQDYNPERVNFEIDHGKVTKATNG